MAEAVGVFTREHGVSEQYASAIHLVLEETVANVILYGYRDAREHTIDVTLSIHGPDVILTVADDAMAFNPLLAPPPELDKPLEERPIGGLGIHLVRSMMDDVQYARRDGRNILTMRKRLP